MYCKPVSVPFLLLCGLAVGAGAAMGQVSSGVDPASGPSVDSVASRLEVLRNAMVEQALDSPVRVTSNAWLDESGRLRHVSRFFSEIRARSAAELIDLSESAAEAKTTAAVAGGVPVSASAKLTSDKPVVSEPPHSVPSATVSNTGLAGAEGRDCLADRSGLIRSALLRTDLIPADGARGQAVLSDVRRVVVDTLSRESGRGGLVLVGSDTSHVDAYARLISSTGQQDAPYQILLRVSSDRTDSLPNGRGALPGQGIVSLGAAGLRKAFAELEQPAALVMPDRRVDLELSLLEVSGRRTVIQHRSSVVIPGASATHNSVALPDVSVAQVRMAALAWWSEAVSRLQCEPLVVQANPLVGSTISIPIGGRVGVRVGDRWVITDKARIPARILEEGTVERIMLAEVVAVGQHRSTLRLTAESAVSSARPGLERGVPWIASPL